MDILAVRLRSPRSGPDVADAQLLEQRGKADRVGVRPGVVGHHPLDPDALLGEEPDGLLDEGDGALGEFVRADRDVGDPGRVVDRHAEKVVADPDVLASILAEDPVAAAGRNATEALHVDADQLAGSLSDIADRKAGQPVGMSEPAKAVAAKDAVHRRARMAEERTEAVPSDPQPAAGDHDPPNLSLGQGPWSTVRSNRAVLEPPR
jgi:hypothetical protein